MPGGDREGGDGDSEHIQLAEVGGVDTDGVTGRPTDVRSDMSGGGVDTKGRQRITSNLNCEIDLEDSGGDTRLLPQNVHHPPRRATWVMGRLQEGDLPPLGKNYPEVNVHKRGGNVCNISGTPQGLRRLGQENMSGDPGGICIGTLCMTLPKYVLEPPNYGGSCGGILRQPF